MASPNPSSLEMGKLRPREIMLIYSKSQNNIESARAKTLESCSLLVEMHSSIAAMEKVCGYLKNRTYIYYMT